jgi:hypothetical protein
MCANEYQRAFQVTTHDGQTYTFDCFECAVTKLAPTCANCQCRVIGHGVTSVEGVICCCDQCASRLDTQGDTLASVSSDRHDDRMRDEALVESFPASDPPSSW